jgi:hypothetical protein
MKNHHHPSSSSSSSSIIVIIIHRHHYDHHHSSLREVFGLSDDSLLAVGRKDQGGRHFHKEYPTDFCSVSMPEAKRGVTYYYLAMRDPVRNSVAWESQRYSSYYRESK